MLDGKDKILLSNLLKEASDMFRNRGCNDINDTYYKNWTDEEIKEFNHKLNVYNGISDAKNTEYVKNAYRYDWWVMGYFADIMLILGDV